MSSVAKLQALACRCCLELGPQLTTAGLAGVLQAHYIAGIPAFNGQQGAGYPNVTSPIDSFI